MTNKKLAIRWQSILEEHPSGHSVANQAKVKISLFKCKRVHEWASSECLPVSKLLDPFFCPDFAFSFVNLSFVFNVCLSSMLNTRLDRFFSRWYTLVCVFVGIFWLMVSLQWKYFCLSSFKQCLCKLCSFCCSPALHVHALQKVMLLQLEQVVIQREILFLLFSEVVIQREVVFYSFRMGSFNGGWCWYIKMHPSSHIAASLFQVTYIWSCLLFAIKQKLILPHQFLNQAPPRSLLGLDLVS